jgi:hypothetical protein
MPELRHHSPIERARREKNYAAVVLFTDKTPYQVGIEIEKWFKEAVTAGDDAGAAAVLEYARAAVRDEALLSLLAKLPSPEEAKKVEREGRHNPKIAMKEIAASFMVLADLLPKDENAFHKEKKKGRLGDFHEVYTVTFAKTQKAITDAVTYRLTLADDDEEMGKLLTFLCTTPPFLAQKEEYSSIAAESIRNYYGGFDLQKIGKAILFCHNLNEGRSITEVFNSPIDKVQVLKSFKALWDSKRQGQGFYEDVARAMALALPSESPPEKA